VSEQSERVGRNEALFREVNERIDQLHDGQGGPEPFDIVCECGDSGCVERFPITNAAYEAVRRDALRFAVVPGHERPDIERVVETYERYLVVEKTDPDAASAAEESA
jgi:hypothetical protein